MPLRIRVTSDAKKQIREANGWWIEHRAAAPDQVRSELERAFLLIASQPRSGSPGLDSGLEGVRRIHLYRIGYHLYYRATASGNVHVLCLWHTSRGDVPKI